MLREKPAFEEVRRNKKLLLFKSVVGERMCVDEFYT